MRDLLISFVCLSLFAGCSRDERRRMDRAPIRIDDLAIPVSGEARSYMQSDRAGAFLTGVVGGSDDGDSWSVGGVEVLDDALEDDQDLGAFHGRQRRRKLLEMRQIP